MPVKTCEHCTNLPWHCECYVDPPSDRGYAALHPVEAEVLDREAGSIGAKDESACLACWIKTFCHQFELGKGYEVKHSLVIAICHTLIAARARNYRLIKERDAARETNRRLNRRCQALESEATKVHASMKAAANVMRDESLRANRYAGELRDIYHHHRKMDRHYLRCWNCRFRRWLRWKIWNRFFAKK